MKKGILFALAALCVSAVQAVTINWSFSNTTYAGRNWNSSNKELLDATSGEQYLGVALIAVPSGTEFALDDFAYTSQTSGDFITGNSKGYTILDQYYGVAGFDAERKGTFTVNQEAMQGKDVYLIFGQPYHYNYTPSVQNAVQFASITALEGEEWNINVDGAGFGLTPGTATVTTSVPEPTALALLALGVAGLALRRKVA